LVSVSSARCVAVAGPEIVVRSRVRRPGSMSLVSVPPTGRFGLLQPPQAPANALGIGRTSRVARTAIAMRLGSMAYIYRRKRAHP
jgi:hypothetical protein